MATAGACRCLIRLDSLVSWMIVWFAQLLHIHLPCLMLLAVFRYLVLFLLTIDFFDDGTTRSRNRCRIGNRALGSVSKHKKAMQRGIRTKEEKRGCYLQKLG